MKVMITGGTGFVGRHLVSELLERGHQVRILVRSEAGLQEMSWRDRVEVIRGDLGSVERHDCESTEGISALIHLAWPNLANFRDLVHFEAHALTSYQFIKRMVDGGCKRVLVTGTCLEYGLQEGCLSESMPTQPTLPYPLGKDSLRRSLELLAQVIRFDLLWARLFYMYGPGQNSKSLLAQLDAAIDRGDATFNMSGGEQLRDYLHVREVARYLADLTETTSHVGIVNVCNGKPISVRKLVEQHIEERQAAIRLNLGHFPYPEYEPFAFWGDNHILRSLENPK